MTLKKTELLELLKSSEGRIFSVVFTKRTTGEEREMVCRLGVRSYLKGGKPSYDFFEKNLLCVFDMQKMGYRTIPLEAVKSVAIDGQKFELND